MIHTSSQIKMLKKWSILTAVMALTFVFVDVKCNSQKKDVNLFLSE